MTTVHTPLQFYRGDTWELDVTCHDGNGVVLNLTGATLEWQLHTAAGVLVTTKTIGNGISVAAPTSGVCVISMEASESGSLAPGYYFDQLRVTLANGDVSTQAVGRIEALSGGPPAPTTAPGEVDWNDPCAVASLLRSAYFKLLAGGAVRIKIGDEEVQFASSSSKDLFAELQRQENLCAIKLGEKPRRFAIGSTYRER